jgi:hypothetical protein
MALRVIDQDAAHHLSCHSDKVSPVLPLNLFLINQAQIGLVDERCWLECVIPSFSPEIPGCDGSQFVVHDGY